MQRSPQLIEDIQDYHSDVQDCIDIAREAQVPRMALTHLVPSPQDSWLLERIFLSTIDRKGWDGHVSVGVDGDCVTLPPAPNSSLIEGNLFVRAGRKVPLRRFGWHYDRSRSNERRKNESIILFLTIAVGILSAGVAVCNWWGT